MNQALLLTGALLLALTSGSGCRSHASRATYPAYYQDWDMSERVAQRLDDARRQAATP